MPVCNAAERQFIVHRSSLPLRLTCSSATCRDHACRPRPYPRPTPPPARQIKSGHEAATTAVSTRTGPISAVACGDFIFARDTASLPLRGRVATGCRNAAGAALPVTRAGGHTAVLASQSRTQPRASGTEAG
eukprot:365523-Chlamydomonas_euryale.AAC.6